MGLNIGNLISASDVNTYVAGKSEELYLSKSIQWWGNPNPITDEIEKWSRDNDIGFPHAVGETDRGLWVSGTTDYMRDETVIGLRRSDGAADGVIWKCLVNNTTTRPGELKVGSNIGIAEWEAVRGNFRLYLDLRGRNVSRLEVVKQKFISNAWEDDYYIVSTSSGDSPHYLWGSNWQTSPRFDYKIQLIPGRYRVTFETHRVGFGTTVYKMYGKPWQQDMNEDEYIRIYKDDLSSFIYGEVTIAAAKAGKLGSSVAADGNPPGGV